MRKILSFIGLFLGVVGLIGGTATLVYTNYYFLAICNSVLGVLAIPTVKKEYKKLTE